MHSKATRVAFSLIGVLLAVPLAFGAKPVEWKKITTQHFTVITPMEQKKAVAWAADFSQFLAAMQGFVPVNARLLPKLTIVLFPRHRDFASYRPLGSDGKPAEVAGFFARHDGWAVAGVSAAGMEGETRRTFFHEGTHWYLSAFELPNPVWLEEGLAEVFSTFEIEAKKVVWGKPVEDHLLVLNSIRPMPVQELFSLAQSDLFTGPKGELRTGLAYAQSWAFVHYLLFGKSEIRPKALSAYVKATREMAPDQAFNSVFGCSYRQMDMRLADYLSDGMYYTGRLPLADIPAATVEPAAQADVEDALARLALTTGNVAKATEHIEAALKLAPDDPRPHDLLARLKLQQDDQKGAVEAFQVAIEKKTADFRAYLLVAATAHEAFEDGKLTSGTVHQNARRIANDYERAINLNPRFEASYTGLAAIIDYLETTTVEDAKFLRTGIALYPANAMLRIGLAITDAKAGRVDDAFVAINQVLAQPTTSPEARQFGEAVRQSLERKTLTGRVEVLLRSKKYAAALKLLDEGIPTVSSPAMKARLGKLRSQVFVYHQLDLARRAGNERRWAEARKILSELPDADIPAAARNELKRLLASVDRNNSGTRGEPPAAPEATVPEAAPIEATPTDGAPREATPSTAH